MKSARFSLVGADEIRPLSLVGTDEIRLHIAVEKLKGRALAKPNRNRIWHAIGVPSEIGESGYCPTEKTNFGSLKDGRTYAVDVILCRGGR